MSSYVAKRSLAHRRQPRRGVILLVVMVLLALLTMLGLTIVLTTAQGRLSALAAARATLESEHDESAMYDVFTQVVAGSNDPNSVFGAHGLLEDMYGLPQFFGQISVPQSINPTLPYVLPLGTTQQNFGQGPAQSGSLMQFTVTATQTPNTFTAVTGNPQQYYQPLPIYSGAFCGQVITMLSGNAAGESARVVGYYYDPTNQANPAIPWAYLQASSFGGRVPSVGDHFMINGRPYSGTGFGFDLTQFQTATPGVWQPLTAAGDVPLLSALENYGQYPSRLPYAYLPNHSKIGLSQYAPTIPPGPTGTGGGPYWDKAGPGGANETYDAPDFQNMMLAMHYWDATAGIPGMGAVITPIPSLHRPELVAWYYSAFGPFSAANLWQRRKMLLRPEPSDHSFNDTNGNGIWDAREPFWDSDGNGAYTPSVDPFLDLNGDGVCSAGETDYSGNTFNPITGSWYIAQNGTWQLDPRGTAGLDVDNDNDGVPDSIWVDAGLAAQKAADGKWYKYLSAVLCIDMDGKLNLNASGSLAQLDPQRYLPPVGTGSVLNGPFAGSTALTEGSVGLGVTGQRTIPLGLGHGPADINLIQMFVRSHGAASARAYYQFFLQGAAYPGAAAPIPQFVDGRYGESSRLTPPPPPVTPPFLYPGVYPPGSVTAAATPALSTSQLIFSGPRPGWSMWYDPFLTNTVGLGGTFDWVNNPVSLARLSDFRTGLLNPKSLTTVPFFFDFLNGATNFTTTLPSHVPTAHGTPSDLLSRGFLATDLRGRPYYASTSVVPWLTVGANWQSTMNDYAVAKYTSLYPWLGNELTQNEMVNSPYAMDLSRNADHEGRNSGNGSTTSSVAMDLPSVDSPLTPTEGEAILRAHDGDSDAALARLNNLETAFWYWQGGTVAQPLHNQLVNQATPPGSMPTTWTPKDNVRLSVATETWDLPVPNVAPTPRQMEDLITYANYVGAATLNFNNISVADLARARIYVENANVPNVLFNSSTAPNGPSGADWALFGTFKNIKQQVTAFPPLATPAAPAIWPLLPSEVTLGMRMDINRLLGNGQDDNGNGVVDEPAEVLFMNAAGNYVGEALQYPTSVVNGVTGTNSVVEWLDLNNDGLLPTANPGGGGVLVDPQTGTTPLGDPSLADMRARQLLAKHLYVMAMLMLDDRSMPGNIAAQIFNTTNPAVLPLPWPQYMNPATGAQLTPREQAAYVVAQWAVNVVDFRDRDSIMTPFEFDLYPFHADDPSNPHATWNVDDVVGTSSNPSPDDMTPAPNSFNPTNPNGIRGLVWGCERPELLMTETLAIHDRGTADTNKGQNLTGGNPDTLVGQGGPPTDNDYDQVRRPRGTTLVELFNATSPWDAPQYDLQYEQFLANLGLPQPWANSDGNGNTGYGVNLAQVAFGATNTTAGPTASPVWRVVIAYSPWNNESAFYTNAPAPGKLLEPRAPVLPPNYTIPNGVANSPKGYIHRAAYFTPFQPSFVNGAIVAGTTMNDVLLSNSFFADPDVFAGFSNTTGASPAVLMLPPAQYALVGPAAPDANLVDTIYIGQNTGAGAAPAYANVQKLQLGNQTGSANPFGTAQYNTVAMYSSPATGGIGPYGAGYSQAPGTSQTIKPVIGVPLQANWLQNAGGGATYVPHSQANLAGIANVATTLRFSVSEPEHGYPIWPAGANTVATLSDDAAYYSTTVGTPTAAVGNFPQHPFDSGVANTQIANPFNDSPNTYVAPDGNTAANKPVMTPSYTVLYLQRLANPLAAWDANANPYITVDSMPVDLTAYTGEPSVATSTTKGEPQYSSGANAGINAFDSRRRGYDAAGNMVGATQMVANVWTPLPINVQLAGGYGIAAGQGTIGTPLPQATLGYLNTEYGPYYFTNGGGNPAPVNNSGIAASNYNGDPVLPMPWVAWNNRPYSSQFELMLVPASSASSLASDFGMLGWETGATLNEFLPGQRAPAQAQQLPVAQFANLLNFFNTQTPNNAGGTTFLPNLFRLFEYVQTPSQFTGTQEMMNPIMFTGDNASPLLSGLPASHMFHTPFNWLSRYRDPGRINLNTVFDPLVFESLTDDYPGQAPLWFNLVNSRIGQANAAGLPLNAGMVAPNPMWAATATGAPGTILSPAYFANPFRPDGAAPFVPPTTWTASGPQPYTFSSQLMHQWTYPGIPGNLLPDYGINTTLLRSQGINSYPANAASMTGASLALFDDTSFDLNNLGATYKSPGTITTPPYPFRNAGQNAYFQYQMFQRLGNTTTNRSNVYAIWITLGKFEVQPVAVDDMHPDGFKLIQPALDATGTQQTQRGFYIFDRSIPVGFQRGESTNIDRAILVERIIPQK